MTDTIRLFDTVHVRRQSSLSGHVHFPLYRVQRQFNSPFLSEPLEIGSGTHRHTLARVSVSSKRDEQGEQRDRKVFVRLGTGFMSSGLSTELI